MGLQCLNNRLHKCWQILRFPACDEFSVHNNLLIYPVCTGIDQVILFYRFDAGPNQSVNLSYSSGKYTANGFFDPDAEQGKALTYYYLVKDKNNNSNQTAPRVEFFDIIDDVPDVQIIEPSIGSIWSGTNTISWTCDNDDEGPCYSDIYYACLQGTDYYPDVAIGRLRVSTETDCTNVVNKILGYDKTPLDDSYYQHFLSAGYFQDDDNNAYADRWFMETSAHVTNFLDNVSIFFPITTHTAWCTNSGTHTNYFYRSLFTLGL